MSLAPKDKRRIYQRDNHTCFYCGKKMEATEGQSVIDSDKKTLDHVFPRVFGGTNRKGNVVCSCFECNMLKGVLPPFFFMKHRIEIKKAIELETEIFQIDKPEYYLIKP